MDFRQIETFIYVYRLRNFSRAGDNLYLTQPTISNHINCLESELGVKLFDRSSRDIIPTEAGCIFYDYAVTLLETRNSAATALTRNGKKIEGRVEIAASTIPSQYLLPRLMNHFRDMYPDIVFVLHQCDTQEVIKELQGKKYQMGIVGARIDEEKLEYKFLTSDKLMLITASENNSQCQQTRIPKESLRDKNFILREPGSGTRKGFEVALKKCGINPDTLKIAAEMNSTETIKSAVREGLGVSVVSSLCIEDDLAAGLIRAFAIDGLDLERAFYLVTYKNRPLPPSAAAFHEYILQYYNNK